MVNNYTLSKMPDVLSISDVCFICNASRPTVLKLTKEKGSPFFRAGSHWKVIKSELFDYLKKRTDEQRGDDNV